MYFIIMLLLTILSIKEINNKREFDKLSFILLFLSLTFILTIRYGQGTDYYAYYLQYSSINPYSSFLNNELLHGEIGWYMIMLFFKKIGLDFDQFIIILSLIMMVSIYKSITRYSPYGIFSLALFYPTYYLTYCFSALRQGLVMSLFLGYGITYLIKKKYLNYYILVALLSLIHRSSLILLFIPILLKLREYKLDKYYVAITFIILIIGQLGITREFFVEKGISTYLDLSISANAIILRSILFYIIYKLYNTTKSFKDNNIKLIEVLYYIYFIGFLIFMSLLSTSILSQRLTMPLKSVEIILLPMLIKKVKAQKFESYYNLIILKVGKFRILASIILILLLMNIECIKNLYSYINQGGYYSWVNPLNYPLSTIFDKSHIENYLPYFKVK